MIMQNRLILTAHGLELTEAMKQFMREKTARLFRHDGRILRVRIDVGMELNKGRDRIFTVRGIVELNGPDLVAFERSENAYAAIERVVNKLDRKLRHRHRRRLFKRTRPPMIDLPAALPKLPVRPNRPHQRAA